MKLNKILGVVAICELMSVFAVAADLNGSWVVKVEGKNGIQEQTYTFKVDGKALTGKLTTQRGDVDIKDGKVDGDNFEFSVERPGRGGAAPMTVTYKGTVSGDTITLKWKQGDNDREAKGERKKS